MVFVQLATVQQEIRVIATHATNTPPAITQDTLSLARVTKDTLVMEGLRASVSFAIFHDLNRH